MQRSVAIRTPSPPSIMHCVHLIQLHRGVYSPQGCLFCTRVYILQRGVILHRGVYSVQGCIFCTGVYILPRGVYSAQGCIFGVVYFSRVYILHKGVYSAQGCIFCTGVYILHRSVYSAQGCIFCQAVYSALGCLFCQGVYAAQGSLFCTQSSVKAGRAFTLLPMCNNCSGRKFGQEQRSEHAPPIHLYFYKHSPFSSHILLTLGLVFVCLIDPFVSHVGDIRS